MGCFRGPRRTRLLTQRGLFNRESESFSGDFRGAGATPTVAFAPQSLSLEPENLVSLGDMAQTPLPTRLMRRAPSLSLSGFSVNYMVGEVPRFQLGSPGRTPFTSFRASSPQPANEVQLLLTPSAFDLLLASGGIIFALPGFRIQEFSSMLPHSAVEVGSHSGVEPTRAITYVDVPHDGLP